MSKEKWHEFLQGLRGNGEGFCARDCGDYKVFGLEWGKRKYIRGKWEGATNILAIRQVELLGEVRSSPSKMRFTNNFKVLLPVLVAS